MSQRETDEAASPWALIVMSRWPQPSRTKTRLIPRLGASGAARLHQQLIARTVQAAASLDARINRCVFIADAPSDANSAALFPSTFTVFAQRGEDLGRRMANAFDVTFAQCPTCDRAVLIGVDCPGYSAALFEDAAAHLLDREIVFAPAEDGGYVLVGVARRVWNTRTDECLFREVPWGTSDVLNRTKQRIAEAQEDSAEHSLRVAHLATLWDVDTPADLERGQREGVFTEQDLLRED